LTRLCNGFDLKREDRKLKDLHIRLFDDDTPENNVFKIVNQLEITGKEKRIPDGILYVNGLPLVAFEFKSAVREEATIHDAWAQLTIRYRRDIPELMKYNALCVISDGVNNRVGSLFAKYDFFYTWKKITGNESAQPDGIDSLHTMIEGLFDPSRLTRVLRHFIYFPDTSNEEVKIVPRYPQFYATNKLYKNILEHLKPEGDGKGGTYFGATGCGKSFTMLFLARQLMRSVELKSPTLVLITDRTDLDDQLSRTFTNAKQYIGDQNIVSVTSRAKLREELQGRTSGGVFLTTIHKFTENTELLTDRTNVICISDEAHRSQTNLDQKIIITEEGVKKSYGFAYHLHNSLPNATYVGFTGTPVDATLDVFGDLVDTYTMTESVRDEITVPIVYEGRAAKVILDNRKLQEIEEYYAQCAEDGASDDQIEASKTATANMGSILGDPDRQKAIAADFVEHYEKRMEEGASVKGKCMFVCANRQIAWDFYKEVVELRPEWAEVKQVAEGESLDGLSEKAAKEVKPMERIKLIMTRGQNDEEALYDMLGTVEYRKELDTQFKKAESNFRIAVVVDMWLTGFDVPFLDTIYIDKPIQRHNLIQTISRVNRKFEGKNKGLVVDYIGIKKQMNLALAHYSKGDQDNFEDIERSLIVVRDNLDVLSKMFHQFDDPDYFNGDPVQQLNCLKRGAEFAQQSEKHERRFMGIVKRLKSAYDICSGSEELSQEERDRAHFYFAIKSVIFKLTKGNAPDVDQMNARVRDMIAEAIESDGVEEIFKLSEDTAGEIDLFSDDYLAKIDKIKLPNTKIKLLQQLLAKAISEFQKTNKAKGVEFTKKMQALVSQYNERDEESVMVSDLLDELAGKMTDLVREVADERGSYHALGIDEQEKAFYDILLSLTVKYDFTYPHEKLIALAKEVKTLVDDKAKYTDWNYREDIKAELKADLIVKLAEHGYPPVERDEVYKEIFEQAENFRKYR
jgi:type I restriction enzyme R subunit